MHRTLVLAWTAWMVLAAPSMAAEPEVYPAKGQTAEQQERDQYACHEWATKETGVDPVALAEEKLAAPTPGEHEGKTGGMARSAGIGAMGGAMEGDAGAGAMRGLGIGRMVSVIRAKRQLREQQSADAQEASALQAQLEKYDRAYAACLTGRGYSVK
jgi:predicted lipid-binding transport protein (Tim44 family)